MISDRHTLPYISAESHIWCELSFEHNIFLEQGNALYWSMCFFSFLI